MEGCTVAGSGAVSGDGAVVVLDDCARDRETQAAATVCSVSTGQVEAVEALEDGLQLVHRNAGAGVLDGDRYFFAGGGSDYHLSPGGSVAQCVVQQVGHDLLNPIWIYGDAGGMAGGNAAESDVVRGVSGGCGIAGGAEQVSDLEGAGVEVEGVFWDAGGEFDVVSESA